MADFVDRIKLIVDMTADKATSGFNDLKKSVGEAEGGVGKLKAGAAGAFDLISANAGLSATAAAGAIAAFAKSAISDFQNLAISAKQFSTQAGTSVEDASRWLEVSDDLGVSSDAVSGAMNRLNREAATGKLAEFGVTTGDVNERLIQTLEKINAIPNAADRAKAQFDLFGKSGAALTPLLSSVGELRARLAEVSGGKLVTDEDAAKAFRLRDALDDLNDRVDSFKLTVGGELAGDLANVAEGLGHVADGANAVIGVIPGLDGGLLGIATGPLRNVADGLNTAADGSQSLTDRARGLGQAITGAIPGPLGSWAAGMFNVKDAQADAKAEIEAANASIEAQAKAADDANKALDALLTATLGAFNSQLSLQTSADKAATSITAYTKANTEAAASNYTNKDATDKVRDSMNEAEGAALKQAAAAAKLASDQAVASGASLTAAQSANIQAGVLETLAGTLDANDPLRSNLLAYAHDLESIPKEKTTTIDADTSQAHEKINGLVSAIQSIVLKPFTVHVNAATSAAPTSAATAGASQTALGASQTAATAPGRTLAPAGASAGATHVVNVNVTAAPFTHPAEIGRQVADYLDAFYRRSGSRLRAVP